VVIWASAESVPSVLGLLSLIGIPALIILAISYVSHSDKAS
jgi:hypothetical protein